MLVAERLEPLAESLCPGCNCRKLTENCALLKAVRSFIGRYSAAREKVNAGLSWMNAQKQLAEERRSRSPYSSAHHRYSEQILGKVSPPTSNM
jgi:hypothetical protein